MKNRVITAEKKFEPVTVEITFESEQEIANFFSRMNKYLTRDELTGSLPQFANWIDTEVTSDNFKVVNRNIFSDMVNDIGMAIGWRKA